MPESPAAPSSATIPIPPDASPAVVSKYAIRLKLCGKEAAKAALKKVSNSHEPTRKAFLDELVRRQAISDFQAGELYRGQIDYLALGPYRPQYLIAAGSFARVFRGIDVTREEGDPRRVVAVKILRERWGDKPGMVDMFRREGELGQRLTHPNIVPIWSVDCGRKRPYFAMEFVEGGDLKEFQKARGKLDPPDALQAGIEICAGLEYALRFGVAHRDLKATNVLMSSSGVCRLIDFGLAADESLLDEAELHNALEYATLERQPGGVEGDPRTDLFFLGTILYELLSGEPPYPRTADRQERKLLTRYRDIAPLSEIAPDVPLAAVDVVDKLLQINASDRYQTPSETTAALQAALVKLGAGGGQIAGAKTADGKTLKTVLFVEHRPKHQDVLREYFTRHGFRPLFLGDPDRAIARMKTAPPDSVVLMGDSIGEDSIAYYRSMRAAEHPPVTVLVLPKSRSEDAEKVRTGNGGRVLVQPVTVRELRRALEKALAES